ncbi:hypothetical protein [Sutterella wadsworthensis]|uniref:hypothetical protein n=1 Tax=Sutterella wadsworthensis TaxID=40545 RepID=UPI00307D1AF6
MDFGDLADCIGILSGPSMISPLYSRSPQPFNLGPERQRLRLVNVFLNAVQHWQTYEEIALILKKTNDALCAGAQTKRLSKSNLFRTCSLKRETKPMGLQTEIQEAAVGF